MILLVCLVSISRTLLSEGMQDARADLPRECEKWDPAAAAPILTQEEEEELLLMQEAALLDEGEIVDGEFLFEEDLAEDLLLDDS